jgi:uncharacterized protein
MPDIRANSQKLVDDALEDLKNSRIGKALENFSAAEKIDPENGNIFRQRGACYAKQGDMHGAVEELDRAIKINSTDAQAFYFRGLAHLRLGDNQSAIVDLYKTLALNPDHGKAKEKLAAISDPKTGGKRRLRPAAKAEIASPGKRSSLALFASLPKDHKQIARTLHPARRFFARNIDLCVATIIIGVVRGLFDFPEMNELAYQMVAGLALVPLEGAQIALFGSTVGKLLYGITLTSKDGPRISLGQSMRRSFNVYLGGVGLYLPLVSLYFVNRGYRELLTERQTGWDVACGTVVKHSPLGIARKLLLAFAWIGIAGLYAAGTIEKAERESGHRATQSSITSRQIAAAPKTGAPTDEMGSMISGILGEIDDRWSEIFQASGQSYAGPHIVLFRNAISGGRCGIVQSATGPFYCASEQQIFLDPEYFREIETRLHGCSGSTCEAAAAYIIAREAGHHIQNLLGILPRVTRLQQQAGSKAESNALQVKVELQADCLSGVWFNREEKKRPGFVETSDINPVLVTASALGDDAIQGESQGHVVPGSFTNGSGEQRKQWFMVGYQQGTVQACNTFSAEKL